MPHPYPIPFPKAQTTFPMRPIFFLLTTFLSTSMLAQDKSLLSAFPAGTVCKQDIPYQGDTLKKHQLDLYLPSGITRPVPLLIFVHGGGWVSNDKTADMGYMRKTIGEVVQRGIAIASIDYRFAQDAVFPEILKDCNRAVSFLYDQAAMYGFDRERFALMGFSAGGHLATLMGLSSNNQIDSFFVPGSSREFRFRAIVDFYGPMDLEKMPNSKAPGAPESILIGGLPSLLPARARAASPLTYIDKLDPPVLIIHGEKDDMVPPAQSQLLQQQLMLKAVPTDLIIVPGAPHYGVMFDAEWIRKRVLAFLERALK